MRQTSRQNSEDFKNEFQNIQFGFGSDLCRGIQKIFGREQFSIFAGQCR